MSDNSQPTTVNEPPLPRPEPPDRVKRDLILQKKPRVGNAKITARERALSAEEIDSLLVQLPTVNAVSVLHRLLVTAIPAAEELELSTDVPEL